MTIETLTYAELGNRLGISPEAARKKARGLRLPTTLGNDGRKRISVDLAEINHSPRPPRRPAGEQAVSGVAIPASEMLKLIDDLRAETGRKSETIAADQHMVRALQFRVAELQAEIASRPTQEALAELKADRDAWREQAQTLVARQSISWWRRLVG